MALPFFSFAMCYSQSLLRGVHAAPYEKTSIRPVCPLRIARHLYCWVLRLSSSPSRAWACDPLETFRHALGPRAGLLWHLPRWQVPRCGALILFDFAGHPGRLFDERQDSARERHSAPFTACPKTICRVFRPPLRTELSAFLLLPFKAHGSRFFTHSLGSQVTLHIF